MNAANGSGTLGNGQATPRSWSDEVRSRGVAILLRLVMPIIHDRGDEHGRAVKAQVGDILQTPDGHFTFVLEIVEDGERGRLIGPKCLHLSALQVLFAAAVRDTFPRENRPSVCVGIKDHEHNRVLMPQKLWLESELEPETRTRADADPKADTE